jgi:hypothetical protein
MLIACSGNENCKSIDREGLFGKEIALAMSLPMESAGTAYGFSSSKAPSAPSEAFASGLWEVRESVFGGNAPQPLPASLAPSKDDATAPAEAAGQKDSTARWLNTPFADYQRFGRWVMYLQTFCKLEVETPGDFWNVQTMAVENATHAFKDRPEPEAKQVMKMLDALTDPVVQLSRDPHNRRACKNLESEIERLAFQLMPAKP